MAERDSTHLTEDDIRAVSYRIENVAYALLSIREMARIAESNLADGESAGLMLRGISIMTRAEFKGLDACVRRLGSPAGIGGFENEFDVQ